jgi:hypothetical protein
VLWESLHAVCADQLLHSCPCSLSPVHSAYVMDALIMYLGLLRSRSMCCQMNITAWRSTSEVCNNSTADHGVVHVSSAMRRQGRQSD